MKFHFIRKLVNDGKIKHQYINTKSMLADGLTKALSGQRMDILLNSPFLSQRGARSAAQNFSFFKISNETFPKGFGRDSSTSYE